MSQATHELLLRADIDRHNGIVNWQGLGLTDILPPWLASIVSWCTRLYVFSNKLSSLPHELFEISGLQMLDLSGNKLVSVPNAVLRLPNLAKLWLNHNVLKCLPECDEWSPSLRLLDISHNHLQTLPNGMRSARLETLRLGNNDFTSIPNVVGYVRTLSTLDLRQLAKVRNLPKSFGLLENLQFLDLTGVALNNVPSSMRGKPREVVAMLRQKLRDCHPAYRMKLVVLGDSQTGKSSVVSSLRGEKNVISRKYGNDAELRVCTVKISKGWGKPKYVFSVWDFSGFEEFRSMHHCLLSPHSMHLLVWKVTDGMVGIQRLRFWLDNIVTYAPDSPVLVVATHTDKLSAEQIASGHLVSMRESLARLITRQPGYQCLQFHGMIETALNGEHVPNLRQTIYRAASSVEVNGKQLMGMSVPSSYSTLCDRIERIAQSRKEIFHCPILDKDEVWDIVHRQMDGGDISTEEELIDAIRYLHVVGSVLHYEVPNGGLDQLLFIDPHWLYAMLARLVMARNKDAFQKTGFLMLSDLEPIYACHRFPAQFHRAFLHLLNRFGVATIWDDAYFFVKNMLEDMPVRDLERHLPSNHKVACYVRTYYMNVVPISFESRLLTRVLLLLRSWLIMCDVSSPNGSLSITGLGKSSAAEDSGSPATDQKASVEDGAPAAGSLFCWRRGIAYITPKLWFTLEMLNRVDSQRCLQLRSSHNEAGCHLMALMATAVHSLFRDWFPHLLSGNDTVMATVQMVNCPNCQSRREERFELQEQKREQLRLRRPTLGEAEDNSSVGTVSTADSRDPEFTFGSCLEALMESDSILCRRCHQGIKLLDLVPEVMLVHVKSHPIVDYTSLCVRDLTKCTDNISDASEGSGTYNGEHVIVRVFTTATPQTFAVDTFDDEIDRALEEGEALPQEQTEEQVVLERAYHQLRLESVGLCSLQHPNLLQCLALCLRPPALVLPTVGCQPLSVVILQRPPVVTRLYLFHCAAQISSALRYMHSLHIAHLGVCSAAILVNSMSFTDKYTIRLGNVGNASRVWPSGTRGLRGNQGYQGPEILRYRGDQEYNGKSADIYALGIIMYEMIARETIAMSNTDTIDADVINGWRPRLKNCRSAKCGFPAMAATAVRCWRSEPRSRPVASRCEAMIRGIDASLLLGGDLMHTNTVPRLAEYAKERNQIWICDDSGDHGCMLTAFDGYKLSKLALHEVFQARVMSMCSVLPLSRNGTPLVNQQIWLALLNRRIQMIDCSKYHCVREVTSPDVVIHLHSSPYWVFMALADGRLIIVPAGDPIRSGKLNIIAQAKMQLGTPRSMVLVNEKELWCSHQGGVSFLWVPDLEPIGQWSSVGGGTLCDLAYDSAAQIVWSFHWRTLELLCWKADDKRELISQVNLANINFAPECTRLPAAEAGEHDGDTKGESSAAGKQSSSPFPAALPTSVPTDVMAEDVAEPDEGKGDAHRSQLVSFQASVDSDKYIQRVLPVLDTLWVGLVDGCVLVLKRSDPSQLLAVLTPHLESVRCLLLIPTQGMSGIGESMVISGGRGRQPSLQYLLSADEETMYQTMVEEDRRWPGSVSRSETRRSGTNLDKRTGALVQWEAVSAETLIVLQQRLLETNSTHN